MESRRWIGGEWARGERGKGEGRGEGTGTEIAFLVLEGFLLHDLALAAAATA